MKRFSGTIVPAPSSIDGPYCEPFGRLRYTVTWDNKQNNGSMLVDVIVHDDHVYSDNIEHFNWVFTNLASTESYVESAILNVKARLK